MWERFHVFWLSTGVPVHVVRYEDLLLRPEEVLAGIVAFVHVRKGGIQLKMRLFIHKNGFGRFVAAPLF